MKPYIKLCMTALLDHSNNVRCHSKNDKAYYSPNNSPLKLYLPWGWWNGCWVDITVDCGLCCLLSWPVTDGRVCMVGRGMGPLTEDCNGWKEVGAEVVSVPEVLGRESLTLFVITRVVAACCICCDWGGRVCCCCRGYTLAVWEMGWIVFRFSYCTLMHMYELLHMIQKYFS